MHAYIRTLLHPSFPPFSHPCRSLWKVMGVHRVRYWFSLAVLREKVSFIFSKIQTKEENIGHVIEGFSHSISVCFLFLPLLLFCPSLFRLSFLSVFLLFMNFLSQFMSLSHSASAVYLLRVLYVRHQVVPNTDLTHPHTACYSCICSCLCDLNLSETHICTEWKHRHIHYTCSRAVLWCVVRLGQSFKLLIEV